MDKATIEALRKRAKTINARVNIVYRFPLVEIDNDIFMQGEDAEEFVNAVDNLLEDCNNELSDYEARQLIAETYIL